MQFFFKTFMFGYFDPKYKLFDNIKINNFRGDLSDVLAKTATLVLNVQLQIMMAILLFLTIISIDGITPMQFALAVLTEFL